MKKLYKSKSTKIVITLLFFIFVLFYLSTIAYSAFSSTMNITGIAKSRIETDVRITDFYIHEASQNATSSYEEFGKDTISSNINLPTQNDYIIYKIEITNYGTTDAGIYEITGLQENLKYELIDYKIKDKLCDNNGKCNSLATKEILIKISGISVNEDIILNFDFRSFCKITYKNISGNYPSEIIYGDDLIIDFSNDKPKYIFITKGNIPSYFYNNYVLEIYKLTEEIEITAIIEEIYEFNYTGNYQMFEAPYDAIYKVELWGASGGNGYSTYQTIDYSMGGKGAYTSGEIYLTTGEKIYIYVGGEGTSTRTDKNYLGLNTGGYNGGNSGRSYHNDNEYVHNGAGGGGATDIRCFIDEQGKCSQTNSLNWNDNLGLNSRLMVAAGGGGGSGHNGRATGGAGGGLESESRSANSWETAGGATQISGGKSQTSEQNLKAESGSFGKGGKCASSFGGGGGGSGYYGGAGGGWAPGTGGTSFISGHEGCDAIYEASTPETPMHTGRALHYSNYKFLNTKMIDGNGYNWTTTKQSLTGMPSYNGISSMTGNTGNGHAKITIQEIITKKEIHISDMKKTNSNNANLTIDKIDKTSLTAKVELSQQIDSQITYEITISNQTDRDYIFKKIEELEYSNKNIIYEINNLTANEIVNINQKKTFTITFKYKSNADITQNILQIKLNFTLEKYYENSFFYTGKYQSVVIPENGIYKIELWGASGGNGYSTFAPVDYSLGGKGAYTSGLIELKKDEIFYLYIGSAAENTRTDKSYIGINAGGYNGGGTGRSHNNNNSYVHNAAGGGGATDIRCFVDQSGSCSKTENTDWNDALGLKSRIMVAAGGGGAGGHTGRNHGGSGGGLESESTNTSNYDISGGATQILGGQPTKTQNEYIAKPGTFGQGGNCASSYAGGGGGSGYYGGSGGGWSSGSGGSSFISGHNGCNAIDLNGNHTDQSIHYSNYYFTETTMIDGSGYNWTTEKGTQTGMPTHDGTSTMTGNTGNGYAKITLIELT